MSARRFRERDERARQHKPLDVDNPDDARSLKFSPIAWASVSGASIFVWSVWVMMTTAALYLVLNGRNYPYTDDLMLANAVTGVQPFGPRWLWSQWNDHRIPLVKLVLVPLFRLTSYDCRSSLFVNVFLLSALSVAMMRVASRLRGHASYSDAFFPLVSLHWAHNCLAWGFQFQFVSSTVLAGILLLLIVLRGDRLGPWSAVLAGGSLVSLPMCGANGLALVPALIVWFVVVGVRLLRSAAPRERTSGRLMMAAASVATLLIPLYYYRHSAARSLTSTYPGPVVAAQAATLFMSGNFGATAVYAFFGEPGRATEALPRLLRLVEPCLMLVGAGAIAFAFARYPRERFRTLGMLLFLAGNFSLLAGLVLGRGAGYDFNWYGTYQHDYGLTPNMILHNPDWHYNILFVPVLYCIYFGFILVGTLSHHPRGFGLLNVCLFLMMAFTAVAFVPTRLANARRYHQEASKFERDVRAGEELEVLVKRYRDFFWCPTAYWDIVGAIRMVHNAGMGTFGAINDPAPRQGVR